MKGKILSLILTVALVVGVTFTNQNFNNVNVSDNNVEEATELKEYTVTSKQLTEIAKVSITDGKKAAEIINEYDGNDFEAGVNIVLTKYYSEENFEELDDFTDNIDAKADVIVEGYVEAAKERARGEKELGYEPGISIVTFGAEMTEEEIEAIVADQYGTCRSIYHCCDGSYMVEVENSLGLTVDKAISAYKTYDETVDVARNDIGYMAVNASDLINDPYRYNQWQLNTMNCGDAWQYIAARSHSKIKLAVVDTGVDAGCGDLALSSLSANVAGDSPVLYSAGHSMCTGMERVLHLHVRHWLIMG